MEVSILGGSTVDITIRNVTVHSHLPSSGRRFNAIRDLPLHAGVATGVCVCRGVSGERCGGGSRYLCILFHRYPPLLTSPSSTHPTHGRMDDLANATNLCLHARVLSPLLGLASGIVTLLRGVGKKTDVHSSVDSVVFLPGSSDESDTRGVLTSRQGTGARIPRGRKRQKSPTHRKVPRFRTGCLAFDGRDASPQPTPI